MGANNMKDMASHHRGRQTQKRKIEDELKNLETKKLKLEPNGEDIFKRPNSP